MNGLASTPSNSAKRRSGLPPDGATGFLRGAARTTKREALLETHEPLIAAIEEAATHFERGEFEEAERLCAEVLAIDARNPQMLATLGMIAYRRGDYAAAAQSMRRALAIDRKNALYHSNLGGALHALGRSHEAVVRYRIALALRSEMAETHYNLANALRDLGRLEEAIASYNTAIGLKPNLARAHNNRADVLRSQGRLAEAVQGYKRAIGCQPQLSEAYTNLGAMLQFDNLLSASLVCHRRAVALAPDRAEAHYNLGTILFAIGDAKAARASYDGALELKPGFADAQFGRSFVCLLEGEFAAGWKQYAFRWQSSHFDTKWREYSQPVWTGGSIERGSVLVWKEQGVGDEIMFAGLVSEMVRRGIPCVLDCDWRLQPLFARSFPEVRVVAGLGAEDAVAQEEIAAHLPIGSLADIFRGDHASFSGTRTPYLLADQAARERFRDRYGARRPRVGLAWHTRNRTTGRRRSIGLEVFASIFKGSGVETKVHWISLQYGSHDALEAEVQAAGLPVTLSFTIDRSVDQLEDMDMFAAQIAALDLVITIDNSTAHLAGALGVPTWVLLPFAADWRWMERREDSPWYPAVRLFRQPRPGDWESVLLKVWEALAAFTLE